MDTKTLISKVAEKTSQDQEQVGRLIEKLSIILADCVKEGDSVAIPGFGSFEPKMRMERVTNHPSTGKKILVPPKLSIVFKPSAILKQKVRKA